MRSYALWNNKGGVGKSFLCFVAASEYAYKHPEMDVYVIDLCPQANVSEILLGGQTKSPKVVADLMKKSPRSTVAGYIEARLNSPFSMISDISPYVCDPSKSNPNIPKNLKLVCGDNLLEILGEAIRQTSQLSVPVTAWKQVTCWVRELCFALSRINENRDSMIFIDCNPSFAIYTQLALVAADNVIVPFTADDSSRRGVENIIALLYGVGNDPHTEAYAKISFSKRAKEESVEIPRLHTFVSNRVTTYDGIASSAFRAMASTIKKTVSNIYQKHRILFANPSIDPGKNFIEIPDYHSACIVASTTGTPLHRITPGPKDVEGERVQLNRIPLDKYKEALNSFVNAL